MLQAIKHALTNLLHLEGRDARQAFWYYVLFLVIINMVVSFLMTIPMMVSSFQTAFDAAQMGMSEEELARQVSAQMGGQMETIMWVSIVVSLATTALLAASFVRRLHDSDHSGWWAAPAVAAQLGAAAFSAGQVGRMKELMAASMNTEDVGVYLDQQMEMMAYGLVGWVAPIIVIIFGVMKSTPGPNRFGETPFTA